MDLGKFALAMELVHDLQVKLHLLLISLGVLCAEPIQNRKIHAGSAILLEQLTLAVELKNGPAHSRQANRLPLHDLDTDRIGEHTLYRGEPDPFQTLDALTNLLQLHGEDICFVRQCRARKDLMNFDSL